MYCPPENLQHQEDAKTTQCYCHTPLLKEVTVAYVCCRELKSSAMFCSELHGGPLCRRPAVYRSGRKCEADEVEEVLSVSEDRTGRRGLIRCLKLQVICRKRDTNYRALLRKISDENQAPYDTTPLYMHSQHSIACWHKYLLPP